MTTKDLINKFSILNGAKYFSSEIFQNQYLLPAKKGIKYFSGTTILENIENVTISDSNFAPIFVDHHVLPNINININDQEI